MSSSEEEKLYKKTKRKEILTGLFATVATIHAAAQVHSTAKKSKERKEALRKGEITAEQAQAGKNKATIQQLASVGIAGIGIKGAIDEMNEAREIHNERIERQEANERHHKKRLEREREKHKRSQSSNR
jgi:hypothetical protein